MLLYGRQDSHYTRLVRVLAAELGIDLPMHPVHGLMRQDPANFGGHPALRLPVLRIGEDGIYGSLNICRVIARAAGREADVAWPQDSCDPLLLNAHELVANAMAMHLELVMHEVVDRRPPDITSTKRHAGLVGSLQWLDERLAAIRASLPPGCVSVFEVSLFCLLEHLPFRGHIDVADFAALANFVREFGARPSALATPCRSEGAVARA